MSTGGSILMSAIVRRWLLLLRRFFSGVAAFRLRGQNRAGGFPTPGSSKTTPLNLMAFSVSSIGVK